MAKRIIAKKCSHCKQIKSVSEFNKNRKKFDGFQGFCRVCQTEYRNTPNRVEAKRLYNREYIKTTKGKETNKHYRQSEKYKLKFKRKHQRYPEKTRAGNAVHNAITRGKLISASKCKCNYCFTQAEEYHHPSYATEHQLNVIPVCRVCHREIHTVLPPK